MLFSPRRRKLTDVDRDAASAMRPGWLRALLMLALFMGVGVIYSRHFDTRLAQIQAQSMFFDESGTWSDNDKRLAAKRAALFQERWGIRLMVQVRKGPLDIPPQAQNALFVGMAPERAQALIVLPDLLARLIRAEGQSRGYDIRLKLEEDMALCLKASPAPDCLSQALDSLQGFLDGSTPL